MSRWTARKQVPPLRVSICSKSHVNLALSLLHLPRLGIHVRTGANVVGHFRAFAFGSRNTNRRICESRNRAQCTRDHLTPFRKQYALIKQRNLCLRTELCFTLTDDNMDWCLGILKGDDYLDARCKIRQWLRTWLCGKASPNSLEVEQSADGPVSRGYAAL